MPDNAANMLLICKKLLNTCRQNLMEEASITEFKDLITMASVTKTE